MNTFMMVNKKKYTFQPLGKNKNWQYMAWHMWQCWFLPTTNASISAVWYIMKCYSQDTYKHSFFFFHTKTTKIFTLVKHKATAIYFSLFISFLHQNLLANWYLSAFHASSPTTGILNKEEWNFCSQKELQNFTIFNICHMRRNTGYAGRGLKQQPLYSVDPGSSPCFC